MHSPIISRALAVIVPLWLALCGAAWPLSARAEGRPVTFPLKASGDGRFLVDAKGVPFFYHADTAWNVTKKLTLDEAKQYLDDRKARGFTAIQVQAVSKEQGPPANRAGRIPFEPLDDILKPDEAYWKHLDSVLDAARERGFFVALAPLWIRWGGNDKEGWRNQLTDENALAYGTFLGERYKRFDNLLWVLGGDANPKEKTAAIGAMGAAIKSAAPHHLITVHNAPEHASAAFFNDARWLDVNMAYSYREVGPHVVAEYFDRKPARPILLGESGYEGEDNDKRGGDAFRMRRQAYAAVLSGALGGHAFGQRHVWRFDAEWRKGLDSPASRQMAHVKALFASRPWHTLVPDRNQKFLVEGSGTVGSNDYAHAAVAADGSLALVYVPVKRTITIDPPRRPWQATARWFDPTDGSFRPAREVERQAERRSFIPPEMNAAGDADFVLVLEVPASE